MYSNINKKVDKTGVKLTSKPEIIFRYQYIDYIRVVDYFQDKVNLLATEHKFKLKLSHRQTLIFLLSSYIAQLKQNYSVYELNSLKVLPKFKTKGTSLTKALKLGSKGTIYKHRERLLDVGALTDVYSDRIENFQYWSIQPFFLMPFEEAKPYVDKLVKTLALIRLNKIEKPPKTAANEVACSIFEHIINKNISKDKDSTVDNVNNSPTPHQFKAEALRAISQIGTEKGTKKGDTRRKPDPAETSKPNSQNFAPEKKGTRLRPAAERPGGGGPGAEGFTGPSLPQLSGNRTAFLYDLVLSFWFFAKSRLYPGQEFNPMKEKAIIETIEAVYFNYDRHELSQAEWKNRFNNYCKQVEIAQRYMEREGFYSPDPCYYFSPIDASRETKNHKEFKFWRVHSWQASQLHQRILLEIRQWQKGKGPHKNKSGNDLFKIHIWRLVKVGHQATLNLFTSKTRLKYVKKV